MATVTAMVALAHIVTTGQGDTATSQLTFRPDFQDDGNQTWAPSTPQLNLVMTVTAAIAAQFTSGAKYTLALTAE
jgi:hypothetical protein